MSSTPRPVQSVSNTELYNRWAKVYDTDGNILQAIDDALLPGLLSQLFASISSTSAPPLNVTELGAGTGRNTVKLLDPSALGESRTEVQISRINALDLSPGMLEVARRRCTKYVEANAATLKEVPKLEFYEFDVLHPSNFPAVKNLEGTADVVLSTLVLEHLPIDVFFRTVKSLLKGQKDGKEGGGRLVLTNMHAEMGRISQAGFVDEATGEKVRGESFNYEVEEVLAEGEKWGFVLEGEVGERGLGEVDMKSGVVGERGRKWVGVRVWFGMVLRSER